MEQIEIEVGELRFDALGAGALGAPLVLLLHGFPQSAYAFRSQLPALAEAGLCAVAPNQRGYSAGARPGEVDAYVMQHLVADVLGMADTLGAQRFHLVGHDWGGQIAWLIAAHHAERILSLSVLSRPHPAAFGSAFKRDRAQSQRSRHHRGFDDPSSGQRLLEDDARRLRRMLEGQGVPSDAASHYIHTLATHDAIEGALAWYRAAPRSAPHMLATAVPAVRVPTLYIWGEQDATVGRTAAELTAEQVCGPYQFVTIPGAGHFITDEAPQRVDELLLAHIKQRG